MSLVAEPKGRFPLGSLPELSESWKLDFDFSKVFVFTEANGDALAEKVANVLCFGFARDVSSKIFCV